MTRLLATAAAASLILLAGCNRGDSQANASGADSGNVALAQANASGNAATAAVTNAIVSSNATPLQKEAALAMVKERHAGYSQIGKAMRAAKKGIDANDLPAVRTAAATINTMAPKASGWFPLGTGNDDVTMPGHKIETRAEIWQQPEKFAGSMKAFQQAAAAFNQAAAGTDVAAMTAAHANLGKTCKSCHDQFRVED
jgi:cytochrome c556